MRNSSKKKPSQTSTDRTYACERSWRHRRRFMFGTSAFCCAVVGYVLFRDLQSAAAEASVQFAFITLGGIVGCYVFGAAWDDRNMMTHGVGRFAPETSSQAYEPVEPVESTPQSIAGAQ